MLSWSSKNRITPFEFFSLCFLSSFTFALHQYPRRVFFFKRSSHRPSTFFQQTRAFEKGILNNRFVQHSSLSPLHIRQSFLSHNVIVTSIVLSKSISSLAQRSGHVHFLDFYNKHHIKFQKQFHFAPAGMDTWTFARILFFDFYGNNSHSLYVHLEHMGILYCSCLSFILAMNNGQNQRLKSKLILFKCLPDHRFSRQMRADPVFLAVMQIKIVKSNVQNNSVTTVEPPI